MAKRDIERRPVVPPLMVAARFIFNFVVLGALLGVLVATWAGPKYIQWDNTIDGGTGLCACAAKAREGADRMISFQMSGMALGAVLGSLGGAVVLFVKKKRSGTKQA